MAGILHASPMVYDKIPVLVQREFIPNIRSAARKFAEEKNARYLSAALPSNPKLPVMAAIRRPSTTLAPSFFTAMRYALPRSFWGNQHER
jgi:hypothetical protein